MPFFWFSKIQIAASCHCLLFAWYFYYKFSYEKIKKTKSGEPLKKGITAIVPVYNEEYHLQIVLESLAEIADQIIVLDNGSTDNSLEVARQFQTKNSRDCEIQVLEFPNHELVDLLNEGLERVKYDWLLRWDGDFVCFEKTRFEKLKQALQNRKRPAAIRLPYLNLCGDYSHAFKPTGAVYPGEFYLRSFNRELNYKLIHGRVEVSVIPLYYRLHEEKMPYIIHLGHIKPIERIMHRHIYRDWGDARKNFPGLTSRYSVIDSFRKDWIWNVLQTDNSLAAKFRFSRLLAIQCEPIDDSLKNSFPDLLKDFIKSHPKQYSVVYENGNPYRIIDEADNDLKNYLPSNEDLDWQPEYEKFYNRSFRLRFLYDLLKN